MFFRKLISRLALMLIVTLPYTQGAFCDDTYDCTVSLTWHRPYKGGCPQGSLQIGHQAITLKPNTQGRISFGIQPFENEKIYGYCSIGPNSDIYLNFTVTTETSHGDTFETNQNMNRSFSDPNAVLMHFDIKNKDSTQACDPRSLYTIYCYKLLP